MRVKGNQTNINDSTLFTMQLNYTPTYNLHHVNCNCVCVCVRACVCVCVRVRASMWLRLLCEAVLILYAILIRPRHTSQVFIIIF